MAKQVKRARREALSNGSQPQTVMRTDKRNANRKGMASYVYVSTDYEAAIPSNLTEDKKSDYEMYTQSVIEDFATEYARDLNRRVDEARGNGRFEDIRDKLKREAHEKEYLRAYGIKNIGLHCEETPRVIANTDTIPRVQGAGIYREHPQTNSCSVNNAQNYAMCQHNPEIGGGYVNIKDYVAEVQKNDPYCVMDVVVPSTGNVSNTGLHRVTIAPTIDENNNVAINPETNLPKMTVYSFNKARKTPLEEYKITHGCCFNLNDYARHNLKEEYEKDPQKTQQKIDNYNQEHQTVKQEQTKVATKAPSVAGIARRQNGGR